MLLVLTMVVTTLMGVMVTDVSAVSVKRDAAAGTVDLEFSAASLPASIAANGTFSIGNWYLYGYTYKEADIDAFFAGTAETIPGTPTTKVNAFETAVVSNVLDPITGESTKYDFKRATVTDGGSAAYKYATGKGYDTKKIFTQNTTSIGKISPNYARISAFPQKLTDKDNSKSYSWNVIKAADAIATYENQTAYKFTFYAYTQNYKAEESITGDAMIFDVRDLAGANSSSIGLSAKFFTTEAGIPHKVDVIISADAEGKTYVHTFIDGVEKPGAFGGGAKQAKDINFQPRFELSSFANGSTMKFSDTDWYITQFGAKTSFTAVSQADLANELMMIPTFGTTDKASKFRTDDFVTGVEAELAADMKAVLTVFEDGSKTNPVKDKVVTIFASKYNNPASLFTGETTNVKLISKTTGKEVAVAEATGTMDDYLFMVNGIYIGATSKPDPVPYVKTTGTSFKAAGHNVVSVRAKHEDFYNNPYTDEKPFGGLTSNFYRFANEPRSSVGFTKGVVKYNDGGYVPMNAYNGGSSVSSTSAALSKYDVKKNIATTEFDIYIPEYTPVGSENFRIAMAFYNDGWSSSNPDNRYSDRTIYFTTGGIKGNMTTAAYLPYTVDVTPNTWNTISIQFDMEAAKVDGMIDCRVYVNGELSTSFDIGDASKGVKFDDEAAKYYAPIAYMRMYTPKYIQYGTTKGAWYIGEYTPKATPVSTGALTSADSNISVIEDELLISSKYATEAETIAALSGYTPVYASAINVNVVNSKYDAVDGTITTKNVSGGYEYTGIIIKRLCDLAGWFDVTVDAETGKNIYTLSSNPTTGVVSAVDNGDKTATLTVTNKFEFTTTVPGAYHDLASLIAENPELRTDTLIGFAVVEEGKLPKVYSLAPSGLDLRNIMYDMATGTAELSYRKFGNVANALSFQLVVAAYDANGKMLDMKASPALTIDSSSADGDNKATFAPAFATGTDSAAKSYKVFMFNSLVNSVPMFKSVKVSK